MDSNNTVYSMEIADRIIPIFSFFIGYSIFAYVLTLLVHPPPELTRKDKKDYLGQHLSIIHAYTAVIMCFGIYVYEGGIHYNKETRLEHVIAVGVKII